MIKAGSMDDVQRRPQRSFWLRSTIWTAVAGLAFAVSVGISTRRFGISLVTGLAMALAIEGVYLLDRAFIQPRLKRLPHDWLRFGLGQILSLLEHIVPALLALLLCSRLFGFAVWDTRAWWAVGGLLVGVPIIHGTETALRLGRQLREKERIEQRLRKLASQAEWKALQAQINPHFLFNSLSTIAQLAHSNPAKAETTIEHLAGMCRYVLAGSERGLVPLREELAFVDAYLEIERACFGERLHVNRVVAPEALDVPVPSLILQPLVENAVRHGRGPGGSVDLTLHVLLQENAVRISVTDQGPGVPRQQSGAEGQGHGLRNVAERLRKTYGEECSLEIQPNVPRGTTAVVCIPKGAER
jgi:signal transduction histidine kinase